MLLTILPYLLPLVAHEVQFLTIMPPCTPVPGPQVLKLQAAKEAAQAKAAAAGSKGKKKSKK